MSALDDLQAKAQAARDALDAPEGVVSELDSDTSDVAGQFLALGSETPALVLQQASSDALTSAREHISQARSALDDYVTACEQAKGSGGA
ncbi:MAG: hypothetical protein GEV10_19740 [Streptosporangiales bacterium]|nr:hypothetical protein [Streptosporangiales bacterium]